MPSFNQFKSVEKLRELERAPLDLTQEGVLSPKRVEEMVVSGLGIKMLYATERVNNKVIDNLFNLAEEADVFTKIQDMQAGEVMNRIEGYDCENRSVLHTAMRDFFDKRNTSPKAKEATELAYQELEKLKYFLEEITKQDFTDMVQIGIGGSDLGPRAIYLALEAFKKPERRAHFISNVDPDDAHKVLSELDISKTLFVVVSKSGSTLETLTNEELVKKYILERGLCPKDHMVAVTGKGSPMDNPEKYRASFYIWDYIGGRYSVTSMVGCVILAFSLGMEKLLDFLKGAGAMDKLALSKTREENLPLMGALLGIWNRNFLHLPTCAIIPYSQAMVRFTAHLQQLDMESNGKRVNKKGDVVDYETGPIIWGEPGTNGQHSFYQCIHQGSSVIPLEFVGFKHSQYSDDVLVQGTFSQEKLLSNLFAQSIGLATGKYSDNPNKFFPGNRPNHILLANKCDPFTLGALLSYFENKVAFQGFMWNINSFDQEGVQLGKVLANKIIDFFAKSRKKEEIDPKEFPVAQSYLHHLEEF
jgi:glucose-6-phosphate isomerase